MFTLGPVLCGFRTRVVSTLVPCGWAFVRRFTLVSGNMVNREMVYGKAEQGFESVACEDLGVFSL